MKKRLMVVLLIFSILLTLNFVYFIAAEGQDKEDTNAADTRQQNADNSKDLKISSGDAALESDYLKLYVNSSNAEITVLDKRSGQVWYSNPPDLDKDTLATGYIKGKIASQITLEYLTEKGQVKEYNSFNDCVQKKQFEIKKQADSVLVTYNFGSKKRVWNPYRKRSAKRGLRIC